MSGVVEDARVSRTQAGVELAVWISVAGGYVAMSVIEVPVRWVFVLLGLALAGYAWVTRRRGREGLRDFGLRADDLGPAAVGAGLFTAVAAAGLVAYGRIRGVPLWRPELAILLPLYPVYGIAQQLAVQGIFHRRLLLLTRSRPLAAVATALAFGLLHATKPALLALTAAAGLGWAILYQRHPNVWPLGVSHGLLAALAYPLALGENPLTAV